MNGYLYNPETQWEDNDLEAAMRDLAADLLCDPRSEDPGSPFALFARAEALADEFEITGDLSTWAASQDCFMEGERLQGLRFN